MADNPINTSSFPVLSEQATHRNGSALADEAQAQGVFLVAVTSDGHVVDIDPRVAQDVASALTPGRKTIGTAGAAAAIVASSTPCKWVQVTALKTNTLDVYVGGSGVVADAGAQTGTPLEAGQSTTIPVDDASKVFIDVLANGEGVTFLVGA